MYLRKLKIENLKRIRSLELDFPKRDDGTPGWTVLIGPNGTAKTSILQAIALSAIGIDNIGDVTDDSMRELLSLPEQGPMKIQANFQSTDDGNMLDTELARTRSGGTEFPATGTQQFILQKDLSKERQRPNIQKPGLFVAAYGVARLLPNDRCSRTRELPPAREARLPQIERIQSLFDFPDKLVSTDFAATLPYHLRPIFVATINSLLDKGHLSLSGIERVTLNSSAAVPDPKERRRRNRVGQTPVNGSKSTLFPTQAMSHGDKSTLALISDLIGHLLLAQRQAGYKSFNLLNVRGLVLIDELELHLHPTRQVELVTQLKSIFPKMQFVVATHSPLLLASIDPRIDRIVDLSVDDQSGTVVRRPFQGDPRLMSSSQLYARYFGLDDFFPGQVGRNLQDYLSLASSPFRSDDEEVEVHRLLALLREADIDAEMMPVSRRLP